MTGYSLPDHLSFGLLEGRPIFLDLIGDRYFMLDGDAERHFLEIVRERPGSEDTERAARLQSLGILKPSTDPAQIQPQPRLPPTASVLDLNERPRASPGHAIEIGVALVAIRRRLARHGLAAIVEPLRRPNRPRSRNRRDGTIEAAALRFLVARRLVPIAPNCLRDSVALSVCLRRRGFDPRLVFGVKLRPFAAHAWLQSESHVLSDPVDIVAAFTPVLTL